MTSSGRVQTSQSVEPADEGGFTLQTPNYPSRAAPTSGNGQTPTPRNDDRSPRPPLGSNNEESSLTSDDDGDVDGSNSEGEDSEADSVSEHQRTNGPPALFSGPRMAADALDAHMRSATGGKPSGAARSQPSLECTPAPEEGFAFIDVAAPGWLFENQSHSQLAAWPTFPGAKVVASIFGRGALDGKLDGSQDSTVGLVEAQINRFLQATNVRASPPIAINGPAAPNSPPYGILVFDLSQAQADALLRQRCISTLDITLLLFPFGIQIPRLILNFGSIANRSEEDVRRMVVVNLRAERNRAALLALIDLSPELTSTHSAKRALNSIVKTATITSSTFLAKRAVPVPVYSLFLDIPISSAEVWIKWRDTLRSFTWIDNKLGTVTVREMGSVRCEGCHGQTHFHWACPFVKLDGWRGGAPGQGGRRPQGSFGNRYARDWIGGGSRDRRGRQY